MRTLKEGSGRPLDFCIGESCCSDLERQIAIEALGEQAEPIA
jgi:hypothetical protein